MMFNNNTLALLRHKATVTLFSMLFVAAFTTTRLSHADQATTSETRPNIVLIVSDDQRPDTIAALGNSFIKTPNLDKLVRRGTSFRRATCANPICSPSRAEILTGCTGMRNGVFDFGRTIHPELTTLPEPFAEAGYATWYCGKWHNNGRPKLHGYQHTSGLFTGGGGKWAKPRVDYRKTPITGYKGWIFRDQDDKPLPDLGIGLHPDTSERIADGAIVAIKQSAGKPFFVHVNFTAPHDPLLPHPDYTELYAPNSIPLPENFAADHPFDHGNRGGRDEVLIPTPRTEKDVKADLAAYYAVISHMDAQIGRILNAIEKSNSGNNTIIAFTSDHGLAMGSHGLRGKQNMYDHTIGVPMILVGPTIPAGKQLDAQVYLRDLFPTLCELANIDPPGFGEFGGKSLVRVIQGQEDSVRKYVIGYFRNSQRMIRSDRWKYIRYPLVNREQLFDIKNDPAEKSNLAAKDAYQLVKKELSDELHMWLTKTGGERAQASKP